MTVGAALAGYPLGALIRQSRRNKLNRWSDKPWFAIIGHEGLCYAEKYLPFSTFGSGLDSLKMTTKDDMLHLVFTFYAETQNGRTYTDHRIPVPFGRKCRPAKSQAKNRFRILGD